MKQFEAQRYQLTLTFSPPFLTQASGTLAFGKDVAMQRFRGQPAINGSLVRGNIRGALQSFITVLGKEQKQGRDLHDFVHKWFGKPAKDESGEVTLTTERSRISFDMFWLPQTPLPNAGQRTRIQLESSGKVKQGAVMVVEDCFPVGSGDVVFSGYLQVNFSRDDKTRKAEKIAFKKYLLLALESISAMGSLKGIGFGKLNKASLEEVEWPQFIKSDTLTETTKRIGFRFKPDRPFCLGKPRTPESNRIVSDKAISGHVIKGVIASLYKGQENWQESLCFDDLIVSHALPIADSVNDSIAGSADKQPDYPLPLSLAFVERPGEAQTLSDFANLSNPLEQDWGDLSRAPIFQPDWKQSHIEEANKQFGVVSKEPDRLVLVRTGIDQKNRVSEEGELFSLECVDPKDFFWQGEISLAQIPQDKQELVLTKLRELFADGLGNIGKTQASATEVELYPVAEPELPCSLSIGDTVVITLKSDARMLAPGFERSDAVQTLRELYKSYWKNSSDDSLELTDFYAQQYRDGGEWHHRHYLKGEQYRPEWLSKAGSVFVLKILNDKGIDFIKSCLSVNLPIAQETSEILRNEPLWKTTPYLPEHGYGQISVGVPVSEKCQADKEVTHV